MFVVPMLESERGWGSKIDGYAGPFDSYLDAVFYQKDYNSKYNNEETVPDWYIAAQQPVPYVHGMDCEYGTTI